MVQSTDGAEWSANEKTTPDKVNLYRIAYDGTRFVGVGQRGRRSTSLDGVHWEDAPGAKALDTLVDVTWGNGAFVGVGLHGLRMSTRDGKTWTQPQRGPEGEHLNSVVWTGKVFAAIGAGATYFSADGEKWERKPNKNAPVCATFGDGVFVGARWKGRILRSIDGIEWNEILKMANHVESVAFLKA
jgi:hypothetical protein